MGNTDQTQPASATAAPVVSQTAASGVTVHELRLSFVWLEALPESSLGPAPQQSSFRAIFDPVEYGSSFAALRGGTSGTTLQLPWPAGKSHLFWTYYLNRQQTQQLGAQDAWKALVPFRHLPATRAALSGPSRVVTEAFCYPGAIAVVVSIRLLGQFELGAAVDFAHKVKRGRVLRGAGGPTTLDEHAAACLAEVRSKALGAQQVLPYVPRDPFTVATVIRADGVDVKAPWTASGAVQDALEGLTQWSATWRENVRRPAAESQLPGRDAPASHVVYGRKRGRAVWFPARFASSNPSSPSLSCYHRNLTMASMQSEALIALCKTADIEVSAGRGLPAVLRECARNASEILGRLNDGMSSVYRCASVKAQIAQHTDKAAVNGIRANFGLQPI